MLHGGRRQRKLLAARVFGVEQHDPTFGPHRFQATMQHRGRAKLAQCDHVTHGEAFLGVLTARNQL